MDENLLPPGMVVETSGQTIDGGHTMSDHVLDADSGITSGAKAFWFRAAERFGLPVVLLLLLCGVLITGARWVGTEILKPAADRHLQFVDTVELSVRQQADTLEVLSRNSAQQLEAMEAMSDEQRAMAKWCEATSKSGQQQEMLLEEIKSKLRPGECD